MGSKELIELILVAVLVISPRAEENAKAICGAAGDTTVCDSNAYCQHSTDQYR